MAPRMAKIRYDGATVGAIARGQVYGSHLVI
jgi:hypothetical protein